MLGEEEEGEEKPGSACGEPPSLHLPGPAGGEERHESVRRKTIARGLLARRRRRRRQERRPWSDRARRLRPRGQAGASSTGGVRCSRALSVGRGGKRSLGTHPARPPRPWLRPRRLSRAGLVVFGGAPSPELFGEEAFGQLEEKAPPEGAAAGAGEGHIPPGGGWAGGLLALFTSEPQTTGAAPRGGNGSFGARILWHHPHAPPPELQECPTWQVATLAGGVAFMSQLAPHVLAPSTPASFARTHSLQGGRQPPSFRPSRDCTSDRESDPWGCCRLHLAGEEGVAKASGQPALRGCR